MESQVTSYACTSLISLYEGNIQYRDRKTCQRETKTPKLDKSWGCRPAAGARKRSAQSSNPFKQQQQQAAFPFMTAKCLAFSPSNLQCSRTSKWLVGTKTLQVTQNRSGILLTDACGICGANLLLLWRTRLLWNVCCLLHVYDDGEVYVGVCRTVYFCNGVGFINVCISLLSSWWECMFLIACLTLIILDALFKRS